MSCVLTSVEMITHYFYSRVNTSKNERLLIYKIYKYMQLTITESKENKSFVEYEVKRFIKGRHVGTDLIWSEM